MSIILLLFVISTLVLAAVITRLVRQYSITNQVVDIPNERSSHSEATPRGGGLSIAVVALLSILFAYLFNWLAFNEFIALIAGLIAIAIVGWLDDHSDIRFYWRFVLYSSAAIWTIYWIGPLDSIVVGSVAVGLPHIAGIIITWLGIVWLTNLYNFMDGTDGIAAMQAILASLFGSALLFFQGEEGNALICLGVVCASIGFLVWNWPPAKIFMGDIGSCVLGFFFATISVITDKSGMMPVSLWCMLLSIFICDATFTLIKRICVGEKWYEAHRSHAYQLLVQMGMSHKMLLLNFILVNLVIIWPATMMAWLYPDMASLCALAVVVSMLVLWSAINIKYNAFRKARTNTG
ncbi:MAG: glycosyltransferase family 4 protein [Gammaproteobacteria bacterium]